MSLNNLTGFLTTLFNEGEYTCYAAQKKGTSVFPYDAPPGWVQFFSINPLYGDVDLGGKAQPGKGRRADINVSGLRNFLIEVDSLPVAEQRKYIDSLLVPWSTCVHSGGKSLHFIIALEEEVTAEEYEKYAKWILKIVNMADQSTKNPSRLSRFPTVIREDKGTKQELIEVRGRVSKETLLAWLRCRVDLEPRDISTEFTCPLSEVAGTFKRGMLWPSTYEYLRGEAPVGMRNRYLFLAACDFHEQNYSIEEALTRLSKASTLPVCEFEETVRSAYQRTPKYGVRTWGINLVKKVGG